MDWLKIGEDYFATLFGGVGLGLILDTVFYYRQPTIYDRFFHWWFALSELNFKQLNRGVMSAILVADTWLFSVKLMSWRVIGFQLLLLMDFSSFAMYFAGVKLPFPGAYVMMLVISIFLSPPCLVAFYVSRKCVSYAALRGTARASLACLSANLLTIVVMLLIIDLIAVSFFMYGIHQSYQKGLGDYDAVDLFMFTAAMFANYKMMLLRIALIPVYFYTALGLTVFVLFLSAKFFERMLAREVEGRRYRAFSALGALLGSVAGIVVPIVQPIISSGYSTFDNSQTAILTECSKLGFQALAQLYPASSRRSIALYARKVSLLAKSEPADNVYPDAMTGLWVYSQLGLGNLSKDDKPVKRFYNDINGFWIGRNNKQLLGTIDGLLKSNPDDIRGLYLKAMYYTVASFDTNQAKEAANRLKAVVYKSSDDSRVRGMADKLANAIAAMPSNKTLAPSNIFDNIMRGKFIEFPGNQNASALWLLVTKQVSLPPEKKVGP